MKQESLLGNEFESHTSGPVECLGMTFENDEARRAHFTELLKEKLKDPEFRAIEGFPIGTDEAILELSDPPYYTACPNPWLNDFVKLWESKKADLEEAYNRQPFASNVTHGKNNPIYNAHSYHTKVPHAAIIPYIEHFTSEGDIVLDGFSGSGMTGVAAQLKNRHIILSDLSPAATFLSSSFCSTYSLESFEQECKELELLIENEVDSLYKLNDGIRDFTIYSTVCECDACYHQFVQWDAIYDPETLKISDEMCCPACSNRLNNKTVRHVTTKVSDPILGEVIETKKRVQCFTKLRVSGKAKDVPVNFDGNSYEEYEGEINSFANNVIPIPKMYESHFKRNLEREGITHFHHFYTPRNYLACKKIQELISNSNPLFKFAFLNTSWHATIMRRYNSGGGHRPKTNTLYVPSLSSEGRMSKVYTKKLSDIKRMLKEKGRVEEKAIINTGSSTSLSQLNDDCIDYIFIDPPFGSNIMYSDLNFIWENWLNVITNNAKEAIENHIQNKSLDDYRGLLLSCFSEFYRVLKPGRWITIVFSNTSASVWNSLRASISEAGFIVANISSLDKKQRSITSYTSNFAVKQDLVICAYKPMLDEVLFSNDGEGGIKSVWEFVNSHLQNLPVFKYSGNMLDFIDERDPRIIFDQVVSYYFKNNLSVPLSSQEFQNELSYKFVERNGMYFTSEQVYIYEREVAKSSGIIQRSIFVSDEASAIEYLRDLLRKKTLLHSDIHPLFLNELSGWKKSELQLELITLLEQNFIKYDGIEEVPAQIHTYLSTNFKDMRGLDKNDPKLKAKAKDRWYVPDPNKAADLEKVRLRALLKEFESYKAEKKKIKQPRAEALRAGFNAAWEAQDFQTILDVSAKIPTDVLQEDEKLLMFYDNALTLTTSEDDEW